MMTKVEVGKRGCLLVELRLREVAEVGLRAREAEDEGSELPKWIRRRKKRNGLEIDIVWI